MGHWPSNVCSVQLYSKDEYLPGSLRVCPLVSVQSSQCVKCENMGFILIPCASRMR